jgi:cytochrome c oxidase subunit 2
MSNSSSNILLLERTIHTTEEEKLVMNLKFILRILLLSGIALSPLAAVDQPGQIISITAQRFSFAPNEITIKKGQLVTLVIQSKDVSHGLRIEDLGVLTDIKKGQTSEVKFTPARSGTFEGKCAHFCGKGHGTMKMTVHVTE